MPKLHQLGDHDLRLHEARYARVAPYVELGIAGIVIAPGPHRPLLAVAPLQSIPACA
jgi:hypothetical protein